MKKIIFDLGNVIVRFDPMAIYSQFTNHPCDAQQLYELLTNLKLWESLDKGINPVEMIHIAQQQAPSHLHQAIENIITQWTTSLEIDRHMEAFVYELVEQGIDVYLLSNTSTQVQSMIAENKVFQVMKGHYLSGATGLVKPTPEIYHDFCKTFHLNPTDCYFIDDRLENIEGAKAIGMDGYHYQFDLDALKKELFSKLKHS